MPANPKSPLIVSCPTCLVKRGKRCVYPNGALREAHASRRDAARFALDTTPKAGPHPTEGTKRLHQDKPPHGTCSTQTDGFYALLERLYQLEDSVSPVGGRDMGSVFAECRAICEHFVPRPFTEIMRNKHG